MALPTHLQGQLHELVLTVPCSNGHKRDRTVAFFVPHSLAQRHNAPLVIAFHGSGEDSRSFRSRTTAYAYDELALREGYVVAYPDGYKGNWNDCRKAVDYPAKVEDVDDVALTRTIIAYAAAHLATAPSQTFLVGYSNGGHLCFRLAHELGSKYIAAVAAHCANMPDESNWDCRAAIRRDAVPIIILNGTCDPVNPFEGGEVALTSGSSRGAHRSAPSTADYFASRFLHAGVGLARPAAHATRAAERVAYREDRGRGRVLVQLVAMLGEGHFVPTRAGEKRALAIGPRRGAVHAPEEALAFFKQATGCFGPTRIRPARSDSTDSDN